MYCNKCGNEIAENMKFCTQCGARRPEPDYVISVCSKCGQAINNDTMNFCTRCGEKIIREKTPFTAAKSYVPIASGKNIIKNDVKAEIISFVGILMLVILSAIYLIAAIKDFERNKNVFEWLEDSYKIFGIFLHWGICVAVVSECMTCIIRVLTSEKKGKYLIGTSVSMLSTAALIWIGNAVREDFEFEEFFIVLHRILGTYEQVILGAFVLMTVTLVCGILCVSMEKNRRA